MALFGTNQKAVIFSPDLVEYGFPADGLILDVSLSERHAIQSTLTTYPIEDGGQLTDHRAQQPRRLEISAFLTDTPTDFVEAVKEAARNLQASITETLGEPVEGPLATTRSKDLYALLELLAENDVLCRVVTDLAIYQNMVLVNLGVPRAMEDGRGLRVDLAFQRVTVARTTTGEALVIEEPAPSTAPPPVVTKKLGNTTPKPKPSSSLRRLTR